MGKYPYILNTGSLRKFLENIPKIGTPTRITQPSFPALGFERDLSDRVDGFKTKVFVMPRRT